jgi:hypothetical protein
MRIVCRFMTHPRTSCASCMGQGEIVTGRGAREGEVASDGGSSGLTALGRLARLCGIAVSAHAQPKALSKAMSRPTPVQPTDAGGAGRRRKCRRFSPEALEMPPGLTGRAPDAGPGRGGVAIGVLVRGGATGSGPARRRRGRRSSPEACRMPVPSRRGFAIGVLLCAGAAGCSDATENGRVHLFMAQPMAQPQVGRIARPGLAQEPIRTVAAKLAILVEPSALHDPS